MGTRNVTAILRFAAFVAFFTAVGAIAEERFVFEKAEMGLPFRITLFAADREAARSAADAAFERIAELNAVLSDYDSDSELSRLSRTSGQGKVVPVSTDLWRVLERAQALAKRTDGAFDITVGPLVNLWRRARRTKKLPSPAQRTELRKRVGFKNLHLDAAAHTAELRLPEMRLDLGAIAKGYAVDEALAVLSRRGISRALVGGSGDMAASEAPPGQPGWKIEVAAIDAAGAPPAEIIFLKNRGIATSGDVFQRVEIDGVRYSHIVDPRTGVGLTDHGLVTVVAPDCLTADSIATAVSVLGPEQGMLLIESAPGVAMHLARQPGTQIEFRESSRWPDLPRVK